jgi:hypothetical protein
MFYEIPDLPPRAFRRTGNPLVSRPATLEGGKGGGSMPSPDPNIGIAQLKLANTSDRLASFMTDEYYPTALKMQKEAAATDARMVGLQEQGATQQLSDAKRASQRYWGTQVPLEDRIITSAVSYDPEAEAARMGREALGDINQQFDTSRGTGLRTLTRQGVAPDNGRFAALDRQALNQEALAKVTALNQTRQAAKDIGWNRQLAAAGIGKGILSAGTQAGQVGIAGAGGAAATAGAPLAAYSGMAGTFGAGLGQANAGYGAMGNLGVQSYGVQSQNWRTAQETDPFNAILGAATGVGMGFGLKRAFG